MANIILPFAAGAAGHQINKSLRLRAGANAGLYRSVATTTNRRIYTLSRWFKLGAQDQGFVLWQGYINASNWTSFIVHASSRQFSFAQADGGVGNWSVISTAAFRDPGAWYHVVIQVDTTDATATNRVRAWVNGVWVPLSVSGAGFPALSKDTYVNVSGAQQGFGYEATNYLLPTDGHHAEVHFVDGQLVAPSAFGRIDPTTGAWVPVVYAGTHGGANGAVHDFRDATSTATLGYDYSGNGAHLTVSGISVAAGVTFDQSNDTPTNNHATFNPLRRAQNIAATISAANLRAKSPSGSYYARAIATQGFEDDGTGRYCEFTLTTAHLGVEAFGVTTATAYANDANVTGTDSGEWAAQGNGATTNIRNNSINAFTGLTLWGAGGVAMIAHRNGKLWLGLNGVWFNLGDPAADTGAVYMGLTGPLFPFCGIGSTTPVIDANFGQRAFAYTPPAGFKSLNAKNMAPPSIKRPSAYMQTVLDTGANIKVTAEAAVTADFLELIKDRANTNNWQAIDTVRGTSAVIQPNTGNAETTYAAPSGNSVGFVWKRGAIPGFDIVSYTGNATAGRAVSHVLGAAPHLIIVKARSVGTDWAVYHRNAAANAHNGVLYLNYTNAYLASGATLQWNQSIPTSGAFSLGGSGYSVNNNGETYIAYLWTEIPGFSRIGAYTGNGAADGPFVWCGFRPRFMLIKRADGTGSWNIIDSARTPFNLASANLLYPDLTNSEYASASPVDVLSSGFKMRDAAGLNAAGGIYVFAAFAETPFKYANAR